MRVYSTTSTGTPFASADEAWFWTMGALRARREGGSGGRSVRSPPCEPDDVVRCLERLYRARRIDAAHVQVLQIWGERQMPPDGGHRGSGHRGSGHRGSGDRDSGERLLWREALDLLAPALLAKGII